LKVVHLTLALLLLLAPASTLAADGHKVTLQGTLVDIACATERSSDLDSLRIKHTRKCLLMPECQKSGYGVLTPNNQVLRFDAAGNERAHALITGTDREKELHVKVSGRQTGDMLTVRKLALAP
jgi:hypothetical protein